MNTKGQAHAYTLAKLFEVKDTGGKGKGLFAKEPVLKGTVVTFECQQCRRILKTTLNRYRRFLFTSVR